jgi:hypothetical protein
MTYRSATMMPKKIVVPVAVGEKGIACSIRFKTGRKGVMAAVKSLQNIFAVSCVQRKV